MRRSSLQGLSVAILLALAFGPSGQWQAGQVYLALGDSVTFGIDPSTPSTLVPSFADQAYVRPLADSLASLNGGVRPAVLNLGIGGELSTTYFSAVSPPGWLFRAPELNLNFPNIPTPQNDRTIASIGAIHASGNSVGYVSFLIGSNDIFYLVGTPAFQNATQADQQAMIAATIGAMQLNYLTVLTGPRTLAPEATFLLPGYYNPFPSFAPEHAFYDAILGVFNPIVRADAAAFGARFVDLYPLFAGRELALTNIGSGDIHPNQAGYALIAGALGQAVPEPTSLSMLAVGLVGPVA